MNPLLINEKLRSFFLEDVGTGDVTTEAIFSSQHTSSARVTAKSEGLFCGGEVIREGFRLLDSQAEITIFVQDGELITKGQILAEINGSTAAILSAERVILNLIQRLSGIASMTARAAALLNDPSIRICDTRKTIPGLRMFDKYAVKCGGGRSHRYGLYDAVMIKDNHISAAGSITEAVRKVKESAGHMIKIEVETTSEREVKEAVEAGADVIMFDNCKPDDIKNCTALVPDGIQTEASGNITLSNIVSYKGCGVHYISLGSLTHSVEAADISLLIESPKQ
ncbi:carboxylating nicotinate-nucleotide diphosphorylase [Halobacillus sp. Marseille-Q1614]|uniref:carboxylating nicotinate-nucleotide diphosphorylase n=1 Tax=Halobacillus sp. Marseille-Q1614 TaxID=2709134 RepID=UPI001571058B|nr:carboxylating nicotinate-nucleotide diphosphorylase [Halobacillus sp. Marseille-Q1614]